MNKQPLAEYEKILTASISNGGQFVFYPSGTSMLPTIIGGEDCVVLTEPTCLKKSDMVLYKRENGQFVLHRIIGTKDGKYIMCGDNQVNFEYGISESQIIAKVSEIRKKDGTVISSDDTKNQVARIFARRFYTRATGKIKRIIKKILNR